MYSGTTFRNKSGHMLGVHQKIDRIARRHLRGLITDAKFPTTKQILYFEGNNGPDGLKRKSPSVDEPWHYIDPMDPSDTALLGLIREHHHNLVAALRAGDDVRAAFEAAWLSHAIVDGLTPAHHYPLAEKIEQLWGKPHTARTSKSDKAFIRTGRATKTIRHNWEYWGAKGVFTTHVLFEHGVGTAVKFFRFNNAALTPELCREAVEQGFDTVFMAAVHDIFALDMYEECWKKGWTTRLARTTRTELMPRIIQTVALAWWLAYREAFES